MHSSTIESCNIETTQNFTGYVSLLSKVSTDRYSNIRSEPFTFISSYIHTCLKVGGEVGGQDEVKRFVETTNYWPKEHRSDDR